MYPCLDILVIRSGTLQQHENEGKFSLRSPKASVEIYMELHIVNTKESESTIFLIR